MKRRRCAGYLVLAWIITAPGCSLAPKAFRGSDLADPAPLVRARAVTMGDRMPSGVVVPELIARLDDPDAVVRLTAHEELKRRTGQDFGYRPWEDRAERGSSIARWQAWWSRSRNPAAVPNIAAKPTRMTLRKRFRWRRD